MLSFCFCKGFSLWMLPKLVHQPLTFQPPRILSVLPWEPGWGWWLEVWARRWGLGGGYNIIWTITYGDLQGSSKPVTRLVSLTGDLKFWEMEAWKSPLFSMWVCYLTSRYIINLYESRGSPIIDFTPRNGIKLCKRIRTGSHVLKREHLTHLPFQVDETVSTSLQAYVMTQMVVLLNVCSHDLFQPHTCLWSIGTGMGIY